MNIIASLANRPGSYQIRFIVIITLFIVYIQDNSRHTNGDKQTVIIHRERGCNHTHLTCCPTTSSALLTVDDGET